MSKITLEQAKEHYKKTDNKILDQCLEQLYPELKEEFVIPKNKKGFFITSSSSIEFLGHSDWEDENDKNLFNTYKQAESALAFAQLSQLKPLYEDEIIGDEVYDIAYPINSSGDFFLKTIKVYSTLQIKKSSNLYSFLIFNKKQNAEKFLADNETLIRQFLML